MNLSKLIPILLPLMMLTASASAQYGIAGGFDYNVDVKRPGFFVRGLYQIDSTWQAAITFNYFFENRVGYTNFELAADAHYRLFQNQRWHTYLIGGINLLNTTEEAAEGARIQKNKPGVNLGLGAQLNLRGPARPFAEMKVSVGDGSLFGLFVGVQYYFQKKEKPPIEK